MATKKGRKIAILLSLIVMAVIAITAWRAWPRLRFWWRFEAIGLNEQGLPEYRHRQTGIVMVKVPGGTFWMGAQKEDPNGQNYDPDAQENEGPVHQVTLSPFLISKYEVSQTEWEKIMGDNPSGYKSKDFPVESVSWDDCQEFCQKTGLSLPSEAQWEYACRAGTSGPYAGTGKLDEMGWYSENSGRKPHSVGQKMPNTFGLHDMHGNVMEWCDDACDPEFYSKPMASGPDPISTLGSGGRIFRGGCRWSYSMGCSPTRRYAGRPISHFHYIGFRPYYRFSP